MKRIIFCILSATFLSTGANSPARADSREEHSWQWPFHEAALDSSGKLVKGRPRRLIFNGMGDFQGFAGQYLHPGVDIMGNYSYQVTFNGKTRTLPDLTVIPVKSKLVRIYDHGDCAGQSIGTVPSDRINAHCRMYFRTEDQHFLYYFGHVRYHTSASPGEEEPNSKLRDTIIASLGSLKNTGVPCAQDCDLDAGALGPMITEFPDSDYDHLHFTIVDRENNYDNVSPFKYLSTWAENYQKTRFDTVDTDDPHIGSIDIFADGGSTSVINNGGTCGPEVSGKLDIIAREVYDVFRNRALDVQDNPISAQLDISNRMAVHRAEYKVTNVATQTVVQQGTWYDFSAGPMFCPGPNQGAACNRNINNRGTAMTLPLLSPPDSDDQSYLDNYLLWGWANTNSSYSAPPMGMLPTGSPSAQTLVSGFSATLYSATNTSYSYSNGSNKYGALILTNEWGTDTNFANQSGVHTNWDTTSAEVPNGRYQIDVEVADQAGHRAGKSMLINVHNSGAFDTSSSAFKDIWLADSDTDAGAVPSNVGGQAYWESPDLLVVPAAGDTGSTPDPSQRVDLLVAGQNYHVWAQVHYGLCNSITGVKVALASANPSTFNRQSSWTWITQPGSTYVGPSGSPGGVSLSPNTATKWVGPFAWTPSAAEVGTDGHRCLLGAITADQDAGNIGDMTDVPGHNNVAQRNIQIGKALMSAMIMNPFSSSANVGLRLSSPDMQQPYTISLDYDPVIESAWSSVHDVTLLHYGPLLYATVNANSVDLTPVTLTGYEERPFAVRVAGPEGSTVTLRMAETANGTDVGGLSMTYTVPVIPH